MMRRQTRRYSRSRKTHRWRRHKSWGGGLPLWSKWPWAYSSPTDDDSQDDDSDSQDSETSPPPGNTCLEDRCTSGYVSWMQQSLNQLGAQLKVTGLLDRNTISALATFKRKNGVAPSEYYASPLIEKVLLKAGASQPPPIRRLSCGSTSAQRLIALLEKSRGDFPLHYLMAWITVESGGELGDLTKICERGYFQIHPEESQDLKLDHDRLSTDPAYSVAGGIQLVKKYASGIDLLARKYGFARTGDLYWGLVKLRHWIPSAPLRILLRMSKSGVPITSWDSVRQYVTSHPQELPSGFDPRAGIQSVDRFLSMAARWWNTLSGTKK